MTIRRETLAGILALAVVAIVAAVLFAPASAHGDTALDNDDVLRIDLAAPVFKSTCVYCHPVIAETRDPDIRFSHGFHIWAPCSSCHEEFPHGPEGTISPGMDVCWYCHGLRHGPHGLIAVDECEKCHLVDLARLRPESHIRGWEGEPHVEPANQRLRTECAMCHELGQCDDCHLAEGVRWRPPVPFTYDPGNACLACHGAPDLAKLTEEGLKSYYVTGIDVSAHRDVTCTECHMDFRYDDEPPETPLWQVNAGLGCMECHEGTHPDLVEDYSASIHGELILQDDYSSATCASCHGGHDIARLDTEKAKRELHFSGEEMCADCHPVEWDSYDDYYHGRAYKRGAPDAPSCWRCHGSHEILPLADPDNLMYPVNAIETCSGEGCHYGVDESFIEASYDLIHGSSEVAAENPVIKWWRSFRGRD